MFISRPVPGYRFPKWAVEYQSVFHAVPGLRSIARCASSPWSPPLPDMPNAVALTGCRMRGAAVATGDGDAWVLWVAVGDGAAGWLDWPTCRAVSPLAPAAGAPLCPLLASR